jgi:beta-glucosidase
VRVDAAAPGRLTLALASPGKRKAVDVASQLKAAAPGQWTNVRVKLSCFAAGGVDVARINMISFAASDPARLSIADVRLTEGMASDECPG